MNTPTFLRHARQGGADALNARLARLPSVERVASSPDVETLIQCYGRTPVLDAIRKVLDEWRGEARSRADAATPAPTIGEIGAELAKRLDADAKGRLRAVFNLTGIVLHTHFGRALLPEDAVQAVAAALSRPVNLEFDLATGRRGERDSIVEDLLCELTGAQAATVVNNNAGAVLLVLSALAAKREVIVSRGELVEIGGSFRMPDIMRAAGTKLREVGTTNRTHLADYESAAGPRCALAMKVHCSNYAISGFTASVGLDELVPAMHERGVPVAVDLGSGTLADLRQWGLPNEPTVRETIGAGADLVTFSTDKLLGGPQAGVVVGRAELIAKLRKHPLKRALRVGKLTLAALEPVLRLYRTPERLPDKLTTLRLLVREVDDIRACAERVRPALQALLGEAYHVSIAPMSSQLGSGAMPVDHLPSYGLMVHAAGGTRGGRQLAKLEAAMRSWPRPVIGRIADGALHLDLRCLEHEDEAAFVAQCAALQGAGP